MNVSWHFAGEAFVNWRPRGSFRALARQFYNYGTGRGHTQIDAAGYTYNLRNLLVLLLVTAMCAVTPWAIAALIGLLGYFYVWTFHRKAVRIVRHTRRLAAYPLCIWVMWVVSASSLCGYLVGTCQRWRNRDRYQRRMRAYLTGSSI